MLVVRPVTPAETVDLRRAVLRDGRPVALPGDDEPAFHLGVYDGQALLATGNVRREDADWLPAGPGWRLRGMATADGARGRGVGRRVLDGLLAHVQEQGGGVVWCHARTPARSFYARAGFVEHGDEWVDPEIGPHVRMVRTDGTTTTDQLRTLLRTESRHPFALPVRSGDPAAPQRTGS